MQRQEILKMKNYIFIFLTTLLFASCGKKDITKNVTVSGNVRNNCTGGSFTGVKVKFTTIQDKSFGKSETTTLISTTDNNGNFAFNDLEINNNSKYKYYLSIDTYSNQYYEFFGISPQELDKGKITNPYKIGVSATFYRMYVILPNGVVINSPDSFSIKCEQKILHSFEPDRLYIHNSYSHNGLSYLSNNIPFLGNYPMGWWHITLNKTKSSVSSTVYDSVYIDMGGTATYTIPW